MNYARTQAGTAAVLNPKIKMPRAMKVMLISMIGGFDSNFHAPRLHVEHNVAALVEALLSAGYIRAVPAANGLPHIGPAEAPLDGFACAPARKEIVQVATSYRPLQDALADISDFVMRYLPGDAFEILFDLEGLTSSAQLKALLRPYERKIRPLGVIADQHLLKVKEILSDAREGVHGTRNKGRGTS